MDDVDAWFPAGLSCLEHAFRIAFEVEARLSFEKVPKGRSGATTGRGAGVTGRKLHVADQDRGALEDVR
ncbi:hypothetical protein [Streptomyces sp. NPDC050388]|uniref:hypothetical protein n=1 Tax=Streptomyces sp. NPDC050388 TaxID=3155781 RepID=UPI003439C860